MSKSSRRILQLALLAVVLAAAWFFSRRHEPAPGPQPGKLVVRFLDVGQGDSELIHLPAGETILIDSGDRGAPTDELLRRYAVRQIDLMIATHPHADHIANMREIMRDFKVKEFWDAGFAYSSKTYTSLLQEIKDRNVKFSTPKQGVKRKFGEVLVEVLHPAPDLPDDNPNNASVVVRLTFGSKKFLFTGDCEVESWRQMIGSEKESLRADLLKAAHHGSSNGTTDAVLDAVQPSIYTLSCANGNDFHHPHPQVITMLERRRDIKVFRTDLQGTITAVCDGDTIVMNTERETAANRLYLTGDEVAGKVGDRTGDKAAAKKRGARMSQ